jgi:hypothetical protein
LTTWAWIETSSADTGSSQTMSLGSQGQRPGDPDALALPARELVRVAVGRARGGRPTRPAALVTTRRAPLGGVADAVDAQRLADDRPDRHARVERAVGVLEDDLHLAPGGPHLARRQAVMSSPSKRMAPPSARSAQTSSGRSWSCRSRFADQAQRLARPTVKSTPSTAAPSRPGAAEQPRP